ncbi:MULTISPECIES: response regulator [Pseudomonas]|uniref:response regulator n=1 Tax=Pseudomonas TaxID=286 RepID=UPI00249C9193|nr:MULTISPECIES: response regulator [Pseudomonas]
MDEDLLSKEEQKALSEVVHEPEISRPAVLLVDDDEAFRELLAEVFHIHGILCFPADGVESAIRLLKKRATISLIVTDLRMGPSGGLELVRWVRESSRSELPVVIMSGQADMQDAIDAMHLNVIDFLLKPVDLQNMLAVVRRELHIEDQPAPDFGA